MIRSVNNIDEIPTSRQVGTKRVLVNADESGCSITQIAVMSLRKGEVDVLHVHPDMQEAYYVQEGEIEVTLDGETSMCKAGDFIYVNAGTTHEIHALTDCKIMTTGCVIEAMREKLYPMLFEPNMHPVVWGGDKLTAWKCLPPRKHVGESWEVSAVPSSPSIVANGTWVGYKLDDVIARRPKEILGKSVASKYGNQLPLLAKFIDANNDLSIQVHPDDAMARCEHNKLGKSEMWYVIDAQPGACLYAGFKKQLTPDEYKRKVEDGAITDALAKHEVHPRDVFYLPAGRVHAICSGILLAEIQQSSDVTYRIFDYYRPGMDGKPRELHTELAAQALDFSVQDEYRTDYAENENAVNKCLDTPYFSVRIIDADSPCHRDLIKYDSFIIVMCISGKCTLRARSTKADVPLTAGNSCLIPAVIADYDIIPQDGSVKLLEAYIDNQKKSFIQNLITGFRHYRN